MKILITGTGGFISNAVYRALLNKYPDAQIVGTTHYTQYNYENHPDRGKKNNIVVECLLENKSWTDRLLSQFKPTHIFHISGVGTQSSSPKLLFDSHVSSTLNLLSSLNQENKPLFIHMSSLVVGSSPFNLYAAAKGSAECIVKAYNDMDKITGVSVRPCAVLGGNNHGLIPDILRKLFNDKEIYLDLRSNSVKPFLFIDVLVEFLLELRTNVVWQEMSPIAISSWDTISVKEIAELVMKMANKYKPIRFLGESFQGDQSKVNAFNSLSEKEFHTHSATINVRVGIEYLLRKYYGIKI